MTEHEPTPVTGSRDPEGETASSWSVEHYGFAGEATPRTAETTERPARTTEPDRPRSRTRLLLATGAIALGLVTGTAGFAVAQASTPGHGEHTGAIHLTADHEGPGGPHGGRR